MQISNFDFWHRLFTPLMLRKAVQQANSLRWLGRTELDGRQNDMVSFAWDNGLTPTLYIDSESHLVSKYELLFPDNLTGDADSLPHRPMVVHHDYKGNFAIRKGKWKLVPGKKPGLFDLESDPKESNNLADGHPEIVKRMAETLAQYQESGRSRDSRK